MKSFFYGLIPVSLYLDRLLVHLTFNPVSVSNCSLNSDNVASLVVSTICCNFCKCSASSFGFTPPACGHGLTLPVLRHCWTRSLTKVFPTWNCLAISRIEPNSPSYALTTRIRKSSEYSFAILFFLFFSIISCPLCSENCNSSLSATTSRFLAQDSDTPPLHRSRDKRQHFVFAIV